MNFYYTELQAFENILYCRLMSPCKGVYLRQKRREVPFSPCLALKKVDTKVNENEDKKSEDTEWQEKDKP